VSSDVAKIIEQTLLGEALMEAPVAASVFDADRHYVAVNEAFCKLTLYSRQELTSLKAGTRLAPDEEAREAIRIAVREHGSAGQVNLRRRDGTIVRTAYWVIETTAVLTPYYLRFSWLPERVPWFTVPATSA
jgi:PAS domain S-box-containing protein